jgi:hypothetical protein
MKRFLMHRRMLLRIALIAALFTSMPASAPALTGRMHIENPSDRHVWITLYVSHALTSWHIAKAGCVAPHSDWRFDIHEPGMYDVKFRAEVKSGDCNSGNISDTYDVRKGLDTYTSIAAAIFFRKNQYHIGIL